MAHAVHLALSDGFGKHHLVATLEETPMDKAK